MKKIVMCILFPITLLSCTNPNTQQNNVAKIANPASEFCIKNNGKLDIRNTPSGQVGYCMFEQNNKKSECEEWAFFRGECKPQS
ncbi:MAG: DUF333 domain-containing protein [Candidatus Sericytochromatia bacterium]